MLLVMADSVSFHDDISELWDSQGEGGTPPAGPAPGGARPHAESRSRPAENGQARPAELGARISDDVARLAEALRANHVDAVSRSGLEAVRSELEGAFTHQLAVALYELLAATNARFAMAEDRMGGQMSAAVGELSERVVRALEAEQQAVAELARTVQVELEAMVRGLGPVDGLTGFQRDVRHEIGRLGDLVTAQNAEAERRSAADADGVDRVVARYEAALTEVGDIRDVLGALRQEVSEMRAEVAGLRSVVMRKARRARRSRRQQRTE